MKNIPVRQIQKSRKEPDLSGNFSIRDLATILDGQDLVQDIHRHDFFYLLIVKTGKGSHEIDFKSYNVFDGSIFFMRPGQVHKISLDKESKGYLLQFENAFYYPFDNDRKKTLFRASIKNHCHLENDNFEKLYRLVQQIYNENGEKQEGFIEVIKANLGIFLIEFIRNKRSTSTTLNIENTYAQERLEELLELIGTHIYKIKQVSEYAKMLNISGYQLNSITKQTLGKTCSEIINENIILESKRNILATSNQINQIAFDLGYEDISYFIRFFKKHTGYTPEAFRQKFK